MRRFILVLLLILGLAPGTWFYRSRPPWNPQVAIHFHPLALPSKAEMARQLGPFRLEGAWRLTSPWGSFGGYSALLPQPHGRLLAIGDYAQWFAFSPPGSLAAAPRAGMVIPGTQRRDRDVEAATQDTVGGVIWTAREDSNKISRHDPAFRRIVSVRPPAMRSWPHNRGAEAMVRLTDGRFVVIAEGRKTFFEAQLHQAVLFPHDPLLGDKAVRFTFAGSPGFSVTDMAQLPDGRVLVLMRRLVWPLPLRFAGRIMLADPAQIRPGAVWRGLEVARLEPPLPVDNFEGLAIEPRPDGQVQVWLISDENGAATQETLLWKLVVDPARLPQARKKARK